MKKITATTSSLNLTRLTSLPLLLMLFAVSTLAFAGGYGKSAKNDIVETATSAGGFNTLFSISVRNTPN